MSSISREFKDGGGYEWKGSGVPEEIQFKGERILPKGEATYCSGFTFAVVMKTAEKRGLLRDKSVEQIRAFQKEWYGATKESGETQCVLAVERPALVNRFRQRRPRRAIFCNCGARTSRATAWYFSNG